MPMKRTFRIVLAVALPLAVGAVSGVATRGAVDTWYRELSKPFFTPPSWVFAPVWTALYVAMGVASAAVWRRGSERPEVRSALGLYLVQLALNGVWSLIFFGARRPGWALLEIMVLLALVLWTTVRFYRVSPRAGALMTPYAAWVAFATVLNASIWWLNAGFSSG